MNALRSIPPNVAVGLPHPLVKFAIPVPGCVMSGPVRERN